MEKRPNIKTRKLWGRFFFTTSLLVVFSFFFMKVFLAFSISPPQNLTIVSHQNESRAIFDEEFLWLTPEGAKETLERIKKAGFNVFIPCVWHGRGTTWDSTFAPMEPRWEKVYDPTYDPLGELIQMAHAMGIEVHPWFTVSLRQRDFLEEYYDVGSPKNSFNVHIPQFRDFIVELTQEVVRKYDIDGINLDYIRAGAHMCTSEFCRNDYRQKFSRDLLKDIRDRKKSNEAWDTIARWNGYSIDDIVKRVSNLSKGSKKTILISVDSHITHRPLILEGADSVKWANNSWIDVIFHMDYHPSLKEKPIKQGIALLKDPNKLFIAIGNRDRINAPFNQRKVLHIGSRNPKNVNDLIVQAENFRKTKKGVAVYKLKFLDDEQIYTLKKGPFRIEASPAW